MERFNITLSNDEFIELCTTATHNPDGTITFSFDSSELLASKVDNLRNIPHKKAKKPRKRTNLKDTSILAMYIAKIQQVIPELIVELDEYNATSTSRKRKSISPEMVGLKIGLGEKTIRANSTLYSAYKNFYKEFFGTPKFNNEW